MARRLSGAAAATREELGKSVSRGWPERNELLLNGLLLLALPIEAEVLLELPLQLSPQLLLADAD